MVKIIRFPAKEDLERFRIRRYLSSECPPIICEAEHLGIREEVEDIISGHGIENTLRIADIQGKPISVCEAIRMIYNDYSERQYELMERAFIFEPERKLIC